MHTDWHVPKVITLPLLCMHACGNTGHDSVHLRIGEMTVRLDSQGPYLVEDTPIAPDVTGGRVEVIVQCLRGRPLDWDLSSVCHVEIFILKVSGQPKISNLSVDM